MRQVRHERVRAVVSSARRLIPARWEVPARYNAMRALGVLEPEVDRLDDWLPTGAVTADVGANFGPYTYALARRSSRVHAFEPNPVCATALRSWRAPNVLVHQVALSDRSGTATLTIPLDGSVERPTQASIAATGDGRTVEVATATLDDFGLDRLDFVKIDVEGHERAVIDGADATLRRCRPLILIEIAARLLTGDTVPEDVIESIRSRAYEGVLLAPSGDVDARRFDAAIHQPLVDGRRGDGYANMFLFRPIDASDSSG